jgi:hypothetical protein
MCHSCAVLGLSSTGITVPDVAGIAGVCIILCSLVYVLFCARWCVYYSVLAGVCIILCSLVYVLFCARWCMYYSVMSCIDIYFGLILWPETCRRLKYSAHYWKAHSHHIYKESNLYTLYEDTPLESHQNCCLSWLKISGFPLFFRCIRKIPKDHY